METTSYFITHIKLELQLTIIITIIIIDHKIPKFLNFLKNWFSWKQLIYASINTMKRFTNFSMLFLYYWRRVQRLIWSNSNWHTIGAHWNYWLYAINMTATISKIIDSSITHSHWANWLQLIGQLIYFTTQRPDNTYQTNSYIQTNTHTHTCTHKHTATNHLQHVSLFFCALLYCVPCSEFVSVLLLFVVLLLLLLLCSNYVHRCLFIVTRLSKQASLVL